MKKICFITQCSLPIPTTKGGAVETLVEYILNENEEKNKFQFTVLSIGDIKAEEQSKRYKNTSFVYIDEVNKKINGVLFQIYRVLKHVGIYIPFSVEFYKVLKALKQLPEYDYYIFEAGPTTQLPALGKIIPKEKLLVHIHWDGMGSVRKDKTFSYLIPVSDYIGNQWMKATGCNSKKILPLYNCAKIDRFTKKTSIEEQRALKEELNIPVENKIVIFTGRIVPEKGIKELLQAINILEDDNVSLLIIGSANFGATTNTLYEKEISKMIENSRKQVVFTGFVHQTELYKYYSIADIAVMPSLFQDPAPLVCIETQATGTPLIATKVGGIPEYTTSQTSILVPQDNNLSQNIASKIKLLLQNEEMRNSMSLAAAEHASQFNTSQYYERFCRIIEEIEMLSSDNNNCNEGERK